MDAGAFSFITVNWSRRSPDWVPGLLVYNHPANDDKKAPFLSGNRALLETPSVRCNIILAAAVFAGAALRFYSG